MRDNKLWLGFLRCWPSLVATALGVGVITQFITAFIGKVSVGAEILWEIPLVVILVYTSWRAVSFKGVDTLKDEQAD